MLCLNPKISYGLICVSQNISITAFRKTRCDSVGLGTELLQVTEGKASPVRLSADFGI